MHSHYPHHSAGYGHQQPHGYPQYPPQHQQPPPFRHIDPNTFRAEYQARLADLTVNSRPIIQSLSMLAQDNTQWAGIVAQCLEAHIRKVSVWMKLPAFYLLDAISKNVFEPYAAHFAQFIARLFLESYFQVDPNTRSKMVEMLLTWRTGDPTTGKELFGIAAQTAIERGIWGGPSGASNSNINNFHSGSGAISQAQVLSELEFTLGQKQRALQVNQYDFAARDDADVLNQLRTLVQGGVSQVELGHILTKLRSYSSASTPVPAHATPAPYPTFPHTHAQPPFPPTLPPFPPTYPQASTSQQQTLPAFVPPPKQEPMVPSVPPVASAIGFAGLFNSLKTLNALSASSTPVGAGASAMESGEEFKVIAAEPAVDLERESQRAYRNELLSNRITLSSSGITRTKANVVPILYDRLRAQCKQCALRFEDTPVGRNKMQDHLDMHFKQNRKANVNLGRGHSRSWFTSVDDWINDIADVKGKGRADGSRPLNTKEAAAADRCRVVAELRARHVVVPPGDEAKTIACPICKEVLPSEFLEDDEEWVWKNAMKEGDRVYHATCKADATSTSNTVATRLKLSSRSTTPETRMTPPPGPAFGTPPRSTEVKTESPRVFNKFMLPPSPPATRTPSPGGLTALQALLARTVADTEKAADDSLKRKAGSDSDGTPPYKKVALSEVL